MSEVKQWALPGTWGKWGTSPACGPRRQRWTRTVWAACQSLCSAYSLPTLADCTGGYAQTPGRCSAWAAGCQTGRLRVKQKRQHSKYCVMCPTACNKFLLIPLLPEGGLVSLHVSVTHFFTFKRQVGLFLLLHDGIYYSVSRWGELLTQN